MVNSKEFVIGVLLHLIDKLVMMGQNAIVNHWAWL